MPSLAMRRWAARSSHASSWWRDSSRHFRCGPVLCPRCEAGWIAGGLQGAWLRIAMRSRCNLISPCQRIANWRWGTSRSCAAPNCWRRFSRRSPWRAIRSGRWPANITRRR
eukprot:gene58595-78171_t